MKRSRSEADDGGLPGPAGRGLEPTQRLTQSVGVARPAAVRHPVPGGGADSRIFQKGAWLQLLSSLDLPTFPPADKSKLDKILALPELKHTCKSIAKNPDTLKVPLFVCAVSWLTSINGGAYVKLQDPTGMVTASIHPEVFGEEFGKDISIGCAMVLRRVSVFSPSRRSRVLSITADNVVRVFPASLPHPSEDALEKMRKREREL
mmetsp:Transcript_49963/g.128583  ORF Transcript_49963/g.128583 Transcript_49963/m.128583 type:complete len:205 (-) Transcript_49963:490-1104(-)|eukprot:CAMPEP_0113870020 /NCGR_PEP_ID=MMETSP0780_2-20120614/1853_1 /TAXON_ID=652834 /ORGANISM="Palpitomonas bilix" /LENGTH=204 /DNA_ID=CAMNT_0000855249 /DNA_START=172 /DNA_END=786 /DNA_ORIENTATION=- /assembly_acc=CAM_ASM_000599